MKTSNLVLIIGTPALIVALLLIAMTLQDLLEPEIGDKTPAFVQPVIQHTPLPTSTHQPTVVIATPIFAYGGTPLPTFTPEPLPTPVHIQQVIVIQNPTPEPTKDAAFSINLSTDAVLGFFFGD